MQKFSILNENIKSATHAHKTTPTKYEKNLVKLSRLLLCKIPNIMPLKIKIILNSSKKSVQIFYDFKS